jgi:DNA-binding NarL/FixJ family response regulator
MSYREEKQVNELVISLQKKRVSLTNRTESLCFLTIREDNGGRLSSLDSFTFISRYGLTRREADVALLLVDGYRNQEIADKLFIGAATVKTHISSIYSKMMVNSRSEMLLKYRSDVQDYS